MKKTIRNNVFETNSSSVHTISIDASGLEQSNLTVKNHFVITDFGSFGKDNAYFDSQADKLSYLITQCYYLNGFDEDIETSYHFKYIEEAICDYIPGIIGIKVLKNHEPDIDHQSLPEYKLHLVNEWDKRSIQHFIFNKYISLHTDCD